MSFPFAGRVLSNPQPDWRAQISSHAVMMLSQRYAERADIGGPGVSRRCMVACVSSHILSTVRVKSRGMVLGCIAPCIPCLSLLVRVMGLRITGALCRDDSVDVVGPADVVAYVPLSFSVVHECGGFEPLRHVHALAFAHWCCGCAPG